MGIIVKGMDATHSGPTARGARTARVVRGVRPSKANAGRYEVVLVVVDLGIGTERALAEALAIGEEQGSLVAVLVIPPDRALLSKTSVGLREEVVAEVRRIAAGRMPPLSAVLVIPHPKQEDLERLVDEIEPDLAVLGTRASSAVDVGATILGTGRPVVLTPLVPRADSN